jgi:hypothetical protein
MPVETWPTNFDVGVVQIKDIPALTLEHYAFRREQDPLGKSGTWQIISSSHYSPVTGARHYLHFGEIFGHGVRAPIGVSHWRGWRWTEGPGPGSPDLFFSQTHLIEPKL